MITKEKIRTGLENGVVKLITNPTFETGTVCQIGANWFYFGGETADNMCPDEYIAKIPTDDIVRSIYDVLEDFKNSGEFMDEYLYYDRVLDESMPEHLSYAVSCYYSDDDYGAVYLFPTEDEAKSFLEETVNSTAQLHPGCTKLEKMNGMGGYVFIETKVDKFFANFQVCKIYR